jgi:hypothetical protein
MKTTIKALSKEELNTVIIEINQAILTVKNSTKAVFLLLKNARKTLNADDYEKLKKSIDLDKSTINKIEKIFQNSVVMNNLESLPISWGTLYEVAQIDTDILITKITDGSINKKSTKNEVSDIRTDLKKSAAQETGKTEPPATSELENPESSAKQSTDTEENEPSAKQPTDTKENELSAKQPIDEFTFTMKESAKTHTKEVKKLLEELKKYFEIPSNLEQFFNEVVA